MISRLDRPHSQPLQDRLAFPDAQGQGDIGRREIGQFPV
jgi:hypothetical protein